MTGTLTLNPTTIGGAIGNYSSYTPTWASSGTQPAFGNATVTARYAQLGKFVHVAISIQFGSTSTFGTGNYTLSVPVNFAGGQAICGFARIYDNSSGNTGIVTCAVVSSSAIQFEYGATYLGTNALVGAAAPWTWAQLDIINAVLVYQAA